MRYRQSDCKWCFGLIGDDEGDWVDYAQVRKLKLERLMWKSSAIASAHHACNHIYRARRWASLMEACKMELEK